ncbi:MAG: TonB-dependent receptor [Pseudomonadota bacterium]|nr:TonB-dependent receptor [Pseudomonadota bacterium]
MRHARLPLTLAISTALLLVGALPLLAQGQDAVEGEKQESQTEPSQLGAITVSARKREETLQEVPVAVTAFNEIALENNNVRDLSDLDAQVPNLTIYAARGSSSTVTAYLRGVGQSDPLWGVDPGVGVYIDDVYIARPQGALLDVIDVDRIEVLRGPQGTLYGKNTIGGAIKYLTKPLSPDFGASTQITFGSYGQADLKASVNVPLGSERLIARFSAASLSRDGYGDNRYSQQQISDKEILVARGQLGFFVSDDFNLVISADWLDDQSGVRGAQRLNAFNLFDPLRTPPLNSRYDTLSGMPNVNDTQMDGASLTANWTINESWWFKSVTAFRESDTNTYIDFDALPNKIVDVRALYADEQLSQEFQFNYQGENLYGVFGLYLFDGEAGGTVFNNFRNLAFGTTNGVVYTESIAVYGEGTWSFTDKLSLTAGLRFTDETKEADVLNRSYANANFITPIFTSTDFRDEVSFSNVSPKISLDYTTDNGTLIYGLVSRGFKSGGFNIRANVAAVPESANPFDDESVTSFEVGVKAGLLDQTLFLNAAAFYNDYKDIQLSVFSAYDSNGDGEDDAFFGDFTNAGKATVSGVETEFQWLPSEHWSIHGNLAFLDAEYDEFITRGVNVANAQKFTNAPDMSGALSAQYNFDAFDGTLSARIGVSYQDKVYPTTDLSEAIAQKDYALYNAGLIWRGPASPWTVSLQGSNLFDKDYRTTGYNIPVLGILTGFYGAPRTFSLSVGYQFD